MEHTIWQPFGGILSIFFLGGGKKMPRITTVHRDAETKFDKI